MFLCLFLFSDCDSDVQQKRPRDYRTTTSTTSTTSTTVTTLRHTSPVEAEPGHFGQKLLAHAREHDKLAVPPEQRRGVARAPVAAVCSDRCR